VDDPLLVGRFERLGDLAGDPHRLPEGEGADVDQDLQGSPLDQLHHQETLLAHVLQAVEGRDVRMVEGGEELGLALEAGEAGLVPLHAGGERLDRHLPVEDRVAGAIDLPHATAPQPTYDQVGTDLCAGIQSGDFSRTELRGDLKGSIRGLV
jgi:hypothetical protein